MIFSCRVVLAMIIMGWEEGFVIMKKEKISRIRTGGQTGVDRAAMDTAREYGIPLCGWCPKNGWAEDYETASELLAVYPELMETPSPGTEQRTKWNMRDADAVLTIIPEDSFLSEGTLLGIKEGEDLGKPMITVSGPSDIPRILSWLDGLPDGIELCVGGPRASECSGAYDVAKEVLAGLFEELDIQPAYELIDESTWPRREHFHYYQEQIPYLHSMTVKVDVETCLQVAHEKKHHFTALLMYVVSKTVNELDCMKMMTEADGSPGIWKVINPVFTVFHQDDHTFSDLWMDYLQDPYSFCMEYDRVTRTFGERKGVKGRPGQPDNFFCFSCPPWIAFESYSSQTPGRIPPLFPIIVCGKYEQTDQGCMMPVSLTVSHAAMDGYHISQFFDRLQENLDTVRITEKV